MATVDTAAAVGGGEHILAADGVPLKVKLSQANRLDPTHAGGPAQLGLERHAVGGRDYVLTDYGFRHGLPVTARPNLSSDQMHQSNEA